MVAFKKPNKFIIYKIIYKSAIVHQNRPKTPAI